MTSRLTEHCVSFSEIYQLVRAYPQHARFLYNKRIQDELGDRFLNEFSESVAPFSAKVPVPLTRLDGAYCFDGSITFGGRMGGSLRDLLTLDGYPQEESVKKAANSLVEGQKLYEKWPRKREFDIEHMESALEASASLFVTNDERTILELLRRAATRYTAEHPVGLIASIARSPTAALPEVRSQLNGGAH